LKRAGSTAPAPLIGYNAGNKTYPLRGLPMKCFDCGKEFRGPEVHDVRSSGQALVSFWKNKNIEVTICPECAAQRRGMLRYWILAFGIALGALGLFGLFWSQQ
jgi:hypothetical protein